IVLIPSHGATGPEQCHRGRSAKRAPSMRAAPCRTHLGGIAHDSAPRASRNGTGTGGGDAQPSTCSGAANVARPLHMDSCADQTSAALQVARAATVGEI